MAQRSEIMRTSTERNSQSDDDSSAKDDEEEAEEPGTPPPDSEPRWLPWTSPENGAKD